MLIKSRRVVLQHIEHSDLETLWRWRNNPRFLKLCSIRREPINVEEFDRELRYDFSRDRHEHFLIIKQSTSLPIGTIFSYNFNPTDGYTFITIYLDEKLEKKGYGALAFSLFCQYLFEIYSLHKIYIEIYSYNEYSLSTSLTGGLVEEGRFKEHRLIDGRRWDLIRFALYSNRLDYIRRLTGLTSVRPSD